MAAFSTLPCTPVQQAVLPQHFMHSPVPKKINVHIFREGKHWGVGEVKEIGNIGVKWDKKEREMAGDILCFYFI